MGVRKMDPVKTLADVRKCKDKAHPLRGHFVEGYVFLMIYTVLKVSLQKNLESYLSLFVSPSRVYPLHSLKPRWIFILDMSSL